MLYNPTRKENTNESDNWGIFRLCMRFLHNNRIPAPDDKINTQSQCIWAVMADLYYLLHGLCIMDVIWGVFEFVPDGIV